MSVDARRRLRSARWRAPRRLIALGIMALAAAQVGAPALADPTAPASGPSTSPATQAANRGDVDPLRHAGLLWHPKGGHAASPPAPPAKAWLLLDSGSGAVLAAQNARLRLPPASTLKTLTAVTLMPRLDVAKVYTATSADAGIEGSGAGLVVGGTYTVKQLFIGLLLPSGNDAATALTHVHHRDGRQALRLMQATAERLGATGTVVKTPSGLPAPGQVSTVADMALFGNAAIHLPLFREVAHLKTYEFPGRMPKPGKERATYQLQNENPLIKRGVPGTLGGKTGFTRKALRTYWGAVRRGDRTLIVVMFGFTGPTYTYASKLLSWGFANAARVQPVGYLPTALGNRWDSEAVPEAATTTPHATPSPADPASASSAGASPLRGDWARPSAAALLLLVPALILARRVARERRRRS